MRQSKNTSSDSSRQQIDVEHLSLKNSRLTSAAMALATEACRKEYLLTQQRIWKKDVAAKFNKKKPEDTSTNITEAKSTSPRMPPRGLTRRTALKPKSEQGFFNGDLLKVLKHHLATNAFTLPEPQRPEEVSRDKDPAYCHYHSTIVVGYRHGSYPLRRATYDLQDFYRKSCSTSP
ncbi:hypothetical protein ACLOJK_036355, partial [Asimina triloba]